MKITKKTTFRIIFLLVIAVFAGEIFARYYLGLGTPPLSVAHPKIEYMFQSNQDVYRFGNRFSTNQYGMRSTPISTEKGKSNEYRVMIFGDSVINGGNLTDHPELATTLLKNKLSETFKQDTVVGNISAGSWGLETGWLTLKNMVFSTLTSLFWWLQATTIPTILHFKL